MRVRVRIQRALGLEKGETDRIASISGKCWCSTMLLGMYQGEMYGCRTLRVSFSLSDVQERN